MADWLHHVIMVLHYAKIRAGQEKSVKGFPSFCPLSIVGLVVGPSHKTFGTCAIGSDPRKTL
jgi:hypothetical protein